MDTTRPNGPFCEYLALVGKFRMPGIDMNAMLESRRKDIEALVAANTTALAGLQSLGQKQMEIVNARIARFQSLAAPRTDSADSKPAVRDTAQDAVRKSVSDMRDLAESAYRVQADTLAVIARRAAEKAEEWKVILKPVK